MTLTSTLAVDARCPFVAVIGSATASPADDAYRSARWVGRLLAASGAVVVTGGRGGVMEAASRGALSHGGTTLGILPGNGPEDSPPNPWVSIPVFTGMGDARNAIVVRTGRSVIAIGGGFGTLAEIGLALKAGRPVILLGSWSCTPPQDLPEMARLLYEAKNPREAVSLAVALAGPSLADAADLAEDEDPADLTGRDGTRGNPRGPGTRPEAQAEPLTGPDDSAEKDLDRKTAASGSTGGLPVRAPAPQG